MANVPQRRAHLDLAELPKVRDFIMPVTHAGVSRLHADLRCGCTVTISSMKWAPSGCWADDPTGVAKVRNTHARMVQ